jgi:hypothetical protein
MMTLPARQRRVLDGIEGALRASEPRMASMFGIFTRLAEDDRSALPERLPRFRLRMSSGVRAFVLLPAAFAMLITGVVLGGTARGSSCGGTRVTGFPLNRVAVASASELRGRPAVKAFGPSGRVTLRRDASRVGGPGGWCLSPGGTAAGPPSRSC